MRGILPGRQAHVRPFRIGPLGDDFCGGLAGHRPMQLVLHGLEKRLRDLGVLVVVDAALLVDIGDLQVEAPFAGPDLPDTFQQLVKIVLAEPLTLLEPLVVRTNPLMMNSRSVWVAQMRNWVACRLLTR